MSFQLCFGLNFYYFYHLGVKREGGGGISLIQTDNSWDTPTLLSHPQYKHETILIYAQIYRLEPYTTIFCIESYKLMASGHYKDHICIVDVFNVVLDMSDFQVIKLKLILFSWTPPPIFILKLIIVLSVHEANRKPLLQIQVNTRCVPR